MPASRQIFDPHRLYSAEEVRTKLGGKTHIITVWGWVKKGRLPKPLKVGLKTSRFHGGELNEHLGLGEDQEGDS